ncbi:wd g-beta repeat-containing protein, partial [Cystoisospora suis]
SSGLPPPEEGTLNLHGFPSEDLLLVQPSFLQIIDSFSGVVRQRLSTGFPVSTSDQTRHSAVQAGLSVPAVAPVGALPRCVVAAQQGKALLSFWSRTKETVAYQVATPEIMTTLGFHPSGSFLFAGSKSGCMYCWQLNAALQNPTESKDAWQGVSLLRKCWPVHYGACSSLVVQDDRLISGGADGSIKAFHFSRILTNNSAAQSASSPIPSEAAIPPIQTWAGHTQSVTALSTVPDLYKSLGACSRTCLVSASLDHSVRIWCWDRSNSFETFVLPAPSRCVAITLPNATLSVCIACDNASIYVVALRSTAVSGSSATAESSQGNVYTVDSSAGCPLWEDTGFSSHRSSRFRVLRGHNGPVRSCVALGDGRLASCAADGVRLWDLEAGAALTHFAHFGGVIGGMLSLKNSSLSNALLLPSLGPLRRSLAQDGQTNVIHFFDRG